MNVLPLLALSVTVNAAPPPPTDAQKLAALARLYGVVRWFHPSDAAQEIDWNRFAVYAVKRVREARTAADLDTTLASVFAPVTVGLVIGPSLPEARPPDLPTVTRLVAWRHLGMGLGAVEPPGMTSPSGSARRTYMSARTNRVAAIDAISNHVPFEAPVTAGLHVDLDLCCGLRARVPLVLSEAEAAVNADGFRRIDALKLAMSARAENAGDGSVDVRTADVVVAWSVFRHFYPYWTEAAVDWDARLIPNLEAATAAVSREAHLAALRRLVAEARDGHGSVRDPHDVRPQAWMPIAAQWLASRLVITGSSIEQVRVGDEITAVDGRTVGPWMSEQLTLVSGSPQRQEVRAILALTRGPAGTGADLTLDRTSATATVEVTRTLREPVDVRPGGPVESRPDLIAEVRPGVWYVDLTRAEWKSLQPRLADLATAAAVIFDVRGYPTDAGARLLPHLMNAPEHDLWMHLPCIVEPFGRVQAWRSFGWNLAPTSPHLTGKVVFLTDARAISYAESVMGYVEALGLGTIVGSATAGTNGNINAFAVPSGMVITYTGMRVTRHDGSPFHLRGVRPAVWISPTIAGIRAGRDEVLECALEIAAPPSPRADTPLGRGAVPPNPECRPPGTGIVDASTGSLGRVSLSHANAKTGVSRRQNRPRSRGDRAILRPSRSSMKQVRHAGSPVASPARDRASWRGAGRTLSRSFG